MLGKGTRGEVHLIKRRSDQKHFIWKKFQNVNGKPPPQALTEINILSQHFQSPFLVRLITYFSTSDATYLVQECCQAGTIDSVIKNTPQNTTEVFYFFVCPSLL